MLMRGGTSKGAYFVREDLPESAEERDDLLRRLLGSPDPRQIDGLGGAHPLTSKVAIVSRSTRDDSDVDFLFAQVGVADGVVDTKPNCGNILAGVGPFALERGLIQPKSDETRVRVYTVNTGTRAELLVSTPGGQVRYDGDEAIDGVPGSSAAIPVNFLDTEGSVTGALFPTGQRRESVCGVEVTCVDNGMPVVLFSASDVGLSGYESCPEIEASSEALKKIEAIRMEAGQQMGLGDVNNAVVPKMFVLSQARSGGAINTRSLIPKKCHESIGVFAAVSVATACVLPGTVAYDLASAPTGMVKVMNIEHPTGSFAVRLELSGDPRDPRVERGGLIRTARALFDGLAFPRSPAG